VAGPLNISFRGFLTVVPIAGGKGIPAEGMSGPSVVPAAAIATALITGGRVPPAEGESCPGTVPATVMVMTFVGDEDGSIPAAPVDLAAGTSSLVEGVSATLCRWGWGEEVEGLQDRFYISTLKATQYF
jgi:hypothetical protein